MVASPIDQRKVVRRPCHCEVPFRAGRELGMATARDLSSQGVGLILPLAVPAGSILTVELPNKAQTAWYLKLVRVAYATPGEQDRWLVGSRFCRDLTDEELRLVLG